MLVLYQTSRPRNRKKEEILRLKPKCLLKCTETGIKVVAINNSFRYETTISFDEISFEKTQLPLYLCSKSSVQRNPVNVFPWFSMMEEVHDLLIYGLCCNEDSLLNSYSYY